MNMPDLIADIMRDPAPATVNLAITPGNMERCKPYIRLLINLLTSIATVSAPRCSTVQILRIGNGK